MAGDLHDTKAALEGFDHHFLLDIEVIGLQLEAGEYVSPNRPKAVFDISQTGTPAPVNGQDNQVAAGATHKTIERLVVFVAPPKVQYVQQLTRYF
jgi:hypothetical protein